MKIKPLIVLLCAILSIGAFGSGPSYFADLDVIETVSRRKLTVNEVMELLDRQPNVKTVTLRCDPPRGFSIETLAYPQYADRYQLTKKEWSDLQAYCTEQLKQGFGVDEVRAHWVSIVKGIPPFGLQVR